MILSSYDCIFGIWSLSVCYSFPMHCLSERKTVRGSVTSDHMHVFATWACMCVCGVCVCVCGHMCLCSHVCVCVCIHVCLDVCVCVCVFV